MPEKVHVMIVEDESIVAMDLAAGLEMDGYVVVGVADHYEEATEIFEKNQVDILLMDINIQGEKDGVQTATALMQLKQVPLIYLTAFTDAATVQRVKETKPSAFLTKPYSIDNVRIAIELALNHFAEAKNDTAGKVLPLHQPMNDGRKNDREQFLQLNDYIFIKQNYKFVKFKPSEILFASADNNYVNIHTKTQRLALRLSLAELIERLRYPRLVRVHRSFSVNLDKIDSFDDQIAKIDTYEIPIGRNYRQEFLGHFNWR